MQPYWTGNLVIAAGTFERRDAIFMTSRMTRDAGAGFDSSQSLQR
jgi:hypothetical protein